MAHSTRNASGDLNETPNIFGLCTTSNRLPEHVGLREEDQLHDPRRTRLVASAK